MGLLDGLLGNMMGGMRGAGRPAQGGNMLLQIALQLLQQSGGIGGLLAKFRQGGFGQQAQSWISTGQNQPITPDILEQIFGRGQLDEIARRNGMSESEAAGGLAEMLPNVVDEMTPQGQIPANDNDLVAQTLENLKRNQ